MKTRDEMQIINKCFNINNCKMFYYVLNFIYNVYFIWDYEGSIAIMRDTTEYANYKNKQTHRQISV